MSETLYQRLGGEKGLSAIVRDTITNHQNNPKIKVRFKDSDFDHLHRMVVDFFGMGSGGPQKYTGKDMKTAHRTMNISPEEFLTVIDDIMDALAKNEIAPETKTEVLGILYSMKDEVVGL